MKLMDSNIESMADATIAPDVQQVSNSGDPDAIGAVSNLMGLRANNRQNVFGSMSGDVQHRYA
jgi:hypothetical protein